LIKEDILNNKHSKLIKSEDDKVLFSNCAEKQGCITDSEMVAQRKRQQEGVRKSLQKNKRP
jgi:hypothetical protein